MLAVGEHTMGVVDDQMMRMSTGFAGGIGGSRLELCGALSAGTMIIGALHGRTQSNVDDRLCQALSARYRDRFVQSFGSTCCGELRRPNQGCAWLVEQAAIVLLDVIDGEDDG